MNNFFIYLLLLLLASKVIHCQLECPEGSNIYFGVCQECNSIIEVMHFCESICESTTQNVSQCKIECDTMRDSYYAYCDQSQCLLIDIRKTPKDCLHNYSDCSGGLVSIDGKYCVNKCLEHQLEVVQEQFTKCQDCQGNGNMKIIENKEVCVKDCASEEVFNLPTGQCIEQSSCSGYLTDSQRVCVESCHKYSGIFTKQNQKIKECLNECSFSFLEYDLGGKTYCVDECPQDYLTDTGNRRCRQHESECPIAGSVDGKKCVDSCNQLNKETIVLKRCTVCTDYWSPNEKSCKKSCSQGEIIDEVNKQCYTFKYQCPVFVSSDGSQCLLSCDPKNKETSILHSDGNVLTQYKQCAVCSDFYYADNVVDKSTCKPICDDDMITIIPLKKCTKNIADCQNYKISDDKKSCSTQCRNTNDVLKDQKCIKEEECQGENEIIDQTTDQKECKDKTAVGYFCPFESEDGRRCVKACSSIEQVESPNINSQKKCDKCKHPLKFKLTSQNGQDIGICYNSEENSNNSEEKNNNNSEENNNNNSEENNNNSEEKNNNSEEKNNNSEEKNNNNNDTDTETPQDLDRLKSMLANLTMIINSTETSKLKPLISPYIDFFVELQKEEQLKPARNVVHKAGSKKEDQKSNF